MEREKGAEKKKKKEKTKEKKIKKEKKKNHITCWKGNAEGAITAAANWQTEKKKEKKYRLAFLFTLKNPSATWKLQFSISAELHYWASEWLKLHNIMGQIHTEMRHRFAVADDQHIIDHFTRDVFVWHWLQWKLRCGEIMPTWIQTSPLFFKAVDDI